MADLARYDYHRPNIQTGDAILWSSNTPIGWFIQTGTGSKYNHISLVIRFNEYDTERVFILEAKAHGIVLRSLRDRLNKFHGKAYWMPMRDIFAPLREDMGREGLNLVGTPYDIKPYFALFDALRYGPGKVKIDDERLTCSEFYQFTFIRALNNYTGAFKEEQLESLVGVPDRMWVPGEIPNILGKGLRKIKG